MDEEETECITEHCVTLFDIHENKKSSDAEIDTSTSINETGPKRLKKRVLMYSDSDNEGVKDNDHCDTNLTSKQTTCLQNSSAETDSDNAEIFIQNQKSLKQRIRSVSASSSDGDTTSLKSPARNASESRIRSKKKKLIHKFKSLVTSRVKDLEFEEASKNISMADKSIEAHSDSSKSDDGEFSIENIKQKIMIKNLVTSKFSSICDPDTSDEETNHQVVEKIKKKVRRSTKLTSPKPIRMSAKQAMENMQKIKSESNRMLREKEVSLPYHRPKAISLKDILSRRKLAVSSDGKVLPIKMNEEQLKEYIKMLEQRQKEIIELCKSDTEDDEESKAQTDSEPSKDDLVHISFDEINTISSVKNINENEVNPNKLDSKIISLSEMPIEGNSSIVDCNFVDKIPNSDVTAITDFVNHQIECEIEKDNMLEQKIHESEKSVPDANADTELESQLISLQYDSEKQNNNMHLIDGDDIEKIDELDNVGNMEFNIDENNISDDDINMDDIDRIIENAQVIECPDQQSQIVNSPMLMTDPFLISNKPKLTGAPGMVIDLEGNDNMPRKLTGIELLKERFMFHAKLKTHEEMERDREKRTKPGTLHLKLKQDLEDEISEKRSLEWEKRLDEEKQQSKANDDVFDEDDIDKIEAQLEEKEGSLDEKDLHEVTGSDGEPEEEPVEDDICMEDKPKKKNPLVDDEAEVSDDDSKVAEDSEDIDESCDESSDLESSPSKDENNVAKKGRIIKAFEDSDDEQELEENEKCCEKDTQNSDPNFEECNVGINNKDNEIHEDSTEYQVHHHDMKHSPDDELHLAQMQKTPSDDLFPSQENILTTSKPDALLSVVANKKSDELDNGTQSFSILEETTKVSGNLDLCLPKNFPVICESQHSQPINASLDAVAEMCSGSFSQDVLSSQIQSTQVPVSQVIGDDVLDLCTGKFYDNEFVSQYENARDIVNEVTQKTNEINGVDIQDINITKKKKPGTENGDLLNSILAELNDPEFDSVAPNKYFCGNATAGDESTNNTLLKKRLVIDSDEETNLTSDETCKEKKKIKKKKPEKRALQISDDENESSDQDGKEEELSDIEPDDPERLVEYDSEENEIEIQPEMKKKKKRKVADFLEREAELTSDDEWAGSGDEDESGLDRMEREAGDDETFHQGRLQRELGQIHMRDVLDQDKREVRLLQELLFEDGDLGDGHRQRKFRWRNADGEEETGNEPNELTDTQEDFESEEQWRKQRHEREVFLRQMKQQENEEEPVNINLNRTSIIKANLYSKTMSDLLLEMNTTKTTDKIEDNKNKTVKKTAKDSIQSPKKPFTIFQQNYHGSLLTRGQGSLARLAALATPLVQDDDGPRITSLGPSSRRNFVFATLTPSDKKPKAAKRKGEENVGTPRLIKKLKGEENKIQKKSLLDYLNM